MMKPLSWGSNFIDYPAAKFVNSIGVKYFAQGSPAEYKPFVTPDREVMDEIAGGKAVYMAEAIFMQGDYPGAHTVTVNKRHNRETLDVSYQDGRLVSMPVDDGPAFFEEDDWKPLEGPQRATLFSLPRHFVEEMVRNGLVHASPIGEVIYQQTMRGKSMVEAVVDVMAPFDVSRVRKGKAPRRWGMPGLRCIGEYLAAAGDPAAMDMSGLSALAVALYLEQEDVVRQLIDAGVDINAPAAAGLYPIDAAILSGDKRMVALCAELGASPNHGGYIQPVLRALDVNNYAADVLKTLLDMGADFDVENHNGQTLTELVGHMPASDRTDILATLTAKRVERAMTAVLDEPAASGRFLAPRSGMSL